MRTRPALIIFLGVLLLGTLAALGFRFGSPLSAKVLVPRTVADVMNRYGAKVEPRLSERFRQAGVTYPPDTLTLLAFKEEKRLEVWGREQNGEWTKVLAYPILAASGVAGPKLKEGDRQVPEGLYRIEGLNPNSRFHLSMKVDYPNAFDRARAREDGRSGLGGDIFIHGRAVSVGCLAMGDAAIEELFVLASRGGVRNVRVIILPYDLRTRPDPVADVPLWLPKLYADLRSALQDFPADAAEPGQKKP